MGQKVSALQTIITQFQQRFTTPWCFVYKLTLQNDDIISRLKLILQCVICHLVPNIWLRDPYL